MLVLTRKQQEKIQIGDNITITVLRTKGKAVRLGIEAPESVPVLRGELAIKRNEEQAQATSTRPVAMKAVEDRSEPTESWRADRPDAETKVAMDRVPRSRVSTVLPKMLGPSAPLRSMLDRRAAAPGA